MIARFLTRYTDRFLSRWTVFSLDLVLVAVTYLAAQFIAFNFQPAMIPWATLPSKAGIVVFIYALAFLHAQSYVGVVRHSGSKDFTRLFQATIEASLALVIVSFTLKNPQFSRVALISQGMLFLITSVGGRLAVRSTFLSIQLRKAKKGTGIVIVGAGSMGRAAQSAIQHEGRNGDHVIAFIDDNRKKAGKNINGTPILKASNALTKEYIEKNNVGKMVVAIKNIPAARVKELSNTALELGLQVKRVPPISSWVNGELTAKQIRPI
ncbi:MAG: hypothetical protein NWS09_03720, partial [Schleiferiaceae bacterium]|nr:hypothetical protein [Schleiferiaceae bacterium]